ncbi:MAG: hypothetical protein QOF75_1073 [Gaiellaceae bacterium]|nr:hypothetical protein [Gaiellaceae bacterium]
MSLPSRAHLLSCKWFWAWALAGAASTLALLVFGMLGIPFVALVVWAMRYRGRTGSSTFGLLTGIGAVLLFVAAVQRGGDDHSLDARPWLVAGVLFAATGVLAHARNARRS